MAKNVLERAQNQLFVCVQICDKFKGLSYDKGFGNTVRNLFIERVVSFFVANKSAFELANGLRIAF
jgi:hypothetical protein